jgi:hypothetical protein
MFGCKHCEQSFYLRSSLACRPSRQHPHIAIRTSKPIRLVIRISPTFLVLAGTPRSSASRAPIGSGKIQRAALQAVGETGTKISRLAFGEIRQIRGKIVIRERPYQGNRIGIPLCRSSTHASRLNQHPVACELLFCLYFLRISLPATILRCAIWSFCLSISLLPWPACSVLAASVPSLRSPLSSSTNS